MNRRGNPAPAPPPHWDTFPRALADGTRLRVVSAAAGKQGVRAGMTVNEAKACCASLEVRPWDDDAIGDAVMAVTATLIGASPQVTPVTGSPGTWWVGATGFDGVGGERALAEQLLRFARRWHPEARVAIADACVTARAGTWGKVGDRGSGIGNRDPGFGIRDSGKAVREGASPYDLDAAITIVPHGGCAAYLATAPLGLVPMVAELREALQALGLHTVGALASLAPGDIERRWGLEGRTAWRLARGDDPRRPGLTRADVARTVSAELPFATSEMAPVLFLVRAALERLVEGLVHDARAAASVAITLSLDAGRYMELEAGAEESAVALLHTSLLAPTSRTITREIRPARPLARVAPLFDQCRALLERWTLPAPIMGVAVSIPATAPLAADQGDLLIPSWRDAAATVDAVFARLRAALDPEGGGDAVVHPVPGNAHRPERAGVWQRADAVELAESGAARDARKSRDARPQRGSGTPDTSRSPAQHDQPASGTHATLRLLETPDAVEVEYPHQHPEAMWWRGRRLVFTHAEGPERLSGDWWRADTFARDYWRCTAEGEGEVLLYREAAADARVRWYLQGWYD